MTENFAGKVTSPKQDGRIVDADHRLALTG